ncbi:ankyrin repeat-containing protein BDA1-like [Telopea speciosissima]|uniref:ankyrin repeat-containing protein BDA1-like n=1 Tax=Telopea speciosissima TaxID=54955 RepID=UPI001CC37C44|nr:ankyrin repeat-containing protein BDA1-like [Telopea speciosissima]
MYRREGGGGLCSDTYHLLLMDPRLIKAAQDGDVYALYALLGEDPYILDKVDKIPFTNTPLHFAAIHDHPSFVMEILNLKPSFSMKLNQDGFSPMHLASTYGCLEVVKLLLKADNGRRLEKMKKILAVDGDHLCNLKGKGRMTPLHCASIAGHVDVLNEFLFHCPKSIMDLTSKEETALHLALKNDKIEVFEELVNWLRRHQQHDLLSWQDQEGNNVLHLAVVLLRGHKKVKMVELLLHTRRNSLVRKAVQVNSKNKHGFTALDLLLMEDEEGVPRGQDDQGRVESILRGVGAKRAHDDIELETGITSRIMKWVYTRYVKPVLKYFSFRVDFDTPSDIRNALFVVIALIATATYQTGITPPGGLWQDVHINSGHDDPVPTHFAGDPIWYTYDPHGYSFVMLCNLLGFIISSILLFNLTVGYPLRGPLQIALCIFLITYVWWTPIVPLNVISKSVPSKVLPTPQLLYDFALVTGVVLIIVLISWVASGNWTRKTRNQFS